MWFKSKKTNGSAASSASSGLSDLGVGLPGAIDAVAAEHAPAEISEAADLPSPSSLQSTASDVEADNASAQKSGLKDKLGAFALRVKRAIPRRALADGAVEALEGSSAEIVEDAHITEDSEPRKRSFWAKLLFADVALAQASGTIPLRVLMGYFPEVSAKDAIEYAQGVAEKHFTQPGITYYGATAYDSGYIYEVHEGGCGRAYAPAIAKYFKSLGEFEPGERATVVLNVATRKVEVQRLRDGISAVLLSETSTREPSSEITQTRPLTPSLQQRTKFFAASAIVFGTGILALILTGFFFRFQTYAPAISKPLDISASNLPRAQWQRLTNVAPGTYVKAIRFKDGRWQSPELGVIEALASAPTPVVGPAPSAAAPTPTQLAAPVTP